MAWRMSGWRLNQFHTERVRRFSALSRGKSGAEALALKLNVKLGQFLRVEEEQPAIVSPGPQVEMSTTEKSGAGESVPVELGTIEIHASVTLTFAVGK